MPSINVEKGFQKKAINGAPNETLAEVLKKACEHFKVDPGSHVFKYKKKDLDLTLSIRFANLPPGAVVELCELDQAAAKKRTVMIALQHEGGPRVQSEVECSMSLSALLKKFEDLCSSRLITGTTEQGETPRVMFMNKAIEGQDQLASTTLVQLGIVSGSVLLKHSLIKQGASESEAAPAAEPPSAPKDEAKTAAVEPAQAQPNVETEAKPLAQAPEEKSATPAVMQGGEAGSICASETSAPMQVENDEKEEEGPGPRDFKVGRPRPGQTQQTIAEVDDSFFELTAADIGALEESKKSKNQEIGFKTKLMREREREAKLAKFKHVPVRVTFPDQTWIQARFAGSDVVASIYALVRDSLVTPERPFYLFLTPPPTKIKDSSEQIKYTELVPSAKLYFSWSEPPAQQGPFMTFEHMETIQRQEEEGGEAMDGLEAASGGAAPDGEAAAEEVEMEEDSRPAAGAGGNVLGSRSEDAGAGEGGPSAAARAAEARAEGGAKKPKWFKMK